MIKEFKISNIHEYDFSEFENNPIVSYGYGHELTDLCGKVVHFSDRRKIINIKFIKQHPIYNIIKQLDPELELDPVYIDENNKKLVVSLVVKLKKVGYGQNRL